jgi:hypothetical protein
MLKLESEKRKRQQWTLQEKLRCIHYMEANPGKTLEDYETKLGIPKRTLRLWRESQADYLLQEQNPEFQLTRKHRKGSEYPDLERVLDIWYVECLSTYPPTPISRELALKKCNEFAELLGYPISEAHRVSLGFLSNWQTGNKISFQRLHGKAGSVPQQIYLQC